MRQFFQDGQCKYMIQSYTFGANIANNIIFNSLRVKKSTFHFAKEDYSSFSKIYTVSTRLKTPQDFQVLELLSCLQGLEFMDSQCLIFHLCILILAVNFC